jgi:hypothetical protein
MPAEPYSDSIEHLQQELSRFDLLLKRAVVIARQAGTNAGPDEFRGLVVTENEVDELLNTKELLGEPWEQAEAKAPELALIDKELDKRRKQIDGSYRRWPFDRHTQDKHRDVRPGPRCGSSGWLEMPSASGNRSWLGTYPTSDDRARGECRPPPRQAGSFFPTSVVARPCNAANRELV